MVGGNFHSVCLQDALLEQKSITLLLTLLLNSNLNE